MRKFIALCLSMALVFTVGITTFAKTVAKSGAEIESNDTQASVDLGLSVGSAVLMEAKSGKILYSVNEYKEASPASVTKIMTLLLVCEALAAGRISTDDQVIVSAYAASMGGSQVFLEEGERISVEDLIKSTVIASANDAAVALAELVAGSESAFVSMMNQRARELGLKNTAFENTTGLDDTTTAHYSCAADIAVMSAELIKHEIVTRYSSMWQDSIRDGEFTLTNTNRLVRYYEGCNGLKTGSTDKAGYCVSATAKRGNMQLIAVIMGAESRDARNEAARRLLDYGFASFGLYEAPGQFLENVPVIFGVKDSVGVYTSDFSALVDKGRISAVEVVYDIPESLAAPFREGAPVGKATYLLDGEEIGSVDIYAGESVDRITFGQIFLRIITRMLTST